MNYGSLYTCGSITQALLKIPIIFSVNGDAAILSIEASGCHRNTEIHIHTKFDVHGLYNILQV